ncbi:NAD(P)H-binding protein [Fodinicola feengrottensis]|uniref:NAD(P)H-binding protein n=1 Tax=Fodinicola feengrottensis TaxID=435914 RepID=A0ABN2FZU5_9ACTN
MSNPILVTGGTGALGRQVVSQLVAAGRPVRIASRRERPAGDTVPYEWATVDYKTGAGLAAAVSGVSAIVHCAGSYFDTSVEDALVPVAIAADRPHLIYISIVGIDRIPFGYYKAKLAAEQVVIGSGLPWTILRTTQFHDLVFRAGDALSRSPIVPLPAGVPVQPIDSAEVADRLVELAAGPPAGAVPDMGGPQVRDATELVRIYLRSKGKRRLLLPIRLPGKAFRAFKNGYHLSEDHAVGRITFEQALSTPVGGKR